MQKIWEFFIRKKSFTALLLVALIIFGFLSILSIPKESNPEVIVPIGIVTTIYPGASALDVEELITNKIEDKLSGGLEDVKKITSTSRETVSSIVVEFNADTDIDKKIQELKDEVDKAKSELPSEAEDPVVSDVDFANEPILLVSISSDLPVTEFIQLSDDVADELKAIPGVSEVQKSGIREREVQVIVKKEALDNFGLSLLEVVQAVSGSNVSLPVGSIKLEGIEYTVRFDGNIQEPSEIENIAVTNRDGEVIFLRDVAFVSDGVSKNTSFSRVSVGGSLSQQAVSFSIIKKSGGDITKISDAVKDKISELQETILADSEVLYSFDVGDLIKSDLRNLSFTGVQTVILVMVILLIAIGWRESLIAGLAIPISFLIGFIGLQASGNTINFISLFSLILSVGILVDSAIVMTEGIHLRIGKHERRRDAARATIREFHWPLTSGTMTTVAVFAPLFFISGVVGQFIKSIPFTIIFVLFASMFVALGFVPLLSAAILRKRTEQTKFSKIQEKYTERLQDWYKSKLHTILGNRKKENLFIAGMIILFFVALAMPISGLVKTTFFEQSDSDFMYVEVEKPEGTTLGETDLAVREVEEILYNENRVTSFVTTVGSGSFFTETGAGTNIGSINLILDENRKETSSQILNDIRKSVSGIRSAKVTVAQPSDGPPTGAPVLIKFFGDDLNELEKVVIEAEKILKEIPGTIDITTSAAKDGTEFVFTVDRAKASQLGISSQVIAQTLRTAVHGLEATSITTNGEDIDVVVKLDLNPDFVDSHDTNRTTIDSLRYVDIQTPNGPVLLGSLVYTSVDKSSSIVRHEDGERVMTLTSDLLEGANARQVSQAFISKIEDNLELPEGITFSVSGETEDVDQSFREMFYSLIAGMILIVSILVLQFNSFKQAFMIIVIVPLSLIGIFAGLLISGEPLSFPSMMGFIALSGIVVNNSIILIDRMNRGRIENPEGSLVNNVIDGAASRLRPILLTTLTTVIGIIPLTYASELWSPLAYAIMFGLSFAVLVTLVLVPILYNRFPVEIED